MCEWSNPCCLTLRVNGSALDLSQDLYIVTVCIPPENSSYLKSTGINPFDLLLQTQHHIPPLSHVIWMGDFNAHLDQENRSSPHVPSKLFPALNFDLPSADPPARTSLDTHKVDSYGRKLLQFCGDRDLTILNGCTPGDSQGYFTYEKGPIRSVIDYAIVSQSIWPLVQNFQVDQHNPILSDHSLIRLELNLAGSKYITHPQAAGQSPLLKFDWSPEATEQLRLRFSSPQFLLQIQLLEGRLNLPSLDVDQIVSDLSNLLLDNTKQVVKFRKRGPPSRKQKSGRKWYDPSLRSLKAQVHRLCTQARVNPSSHLLQAVRAKTKAYRSLLKLKACCFKQHIQGKMASTSDKSPKEWWSLLKDLKANAKWEDPDQHASLEDLTSFFQSSYKDASLDTDAQHNPGLTFSCSDYFRSNPPTQPVVDDLRNNPSPKLRFPKSSSAYLWARQLVWIIFQTRC